MGQRSSGVTVSYLRWTCIPEKVIHTAIFWLTLSHWYDRPSSVNGKTDSAAMEEEELVGDIDVCAV